MINLNKKNQKILITGGTGYIGSALTKEFLADDQKVTILTRKNKSSDNKNLTYIKDLPAAENFDFDIVINLCGETIAQRWNKFSKERIYNSRVKTTENLTKIISQTKTPPKLVINGSAIGVYGTSLTENFTEETKINNQNFFSQKLCLDWENAAKDISKYSRLAIIRTGVVIGKNSGILRKMLPAFKFGLGGKIGNGNQILSWIHIDDWVGIAAKIINDQNLSGPINATSPNSVTNQEFSKILAKSLNRPCFFDMPSLAAKILFGQMAEELLLDGQKVIPEKILKNNYQFQFEHLEKAIKSSI